MLPLRSLVPLTFMAGSFAVGILAIIVSLAAFNGEEYEHDDKIGVQMGVKADLTQGDIHVWIHAPSALYIYTKIFNMMKVSEDGTTTEADIAGLFPTGDPSNGIGELSFTMYGVGEEQMPDLSKRNQELAPMVFVKRSSAYPTFLRYMMLMSAVCLNNWAFVQLGVLASGFFLIATGGILLVINKSKNANMVQELEEEETE